MLKKLNVQSKKGKKFESGYIEEISLPSIPRVVIPSGSIRFLISIFVTGRPANLKAMTNFASYEIGGMYKK